jgi:glycosyltransferase involved in cell wall biosynthesis
MIKILILMATDRFSSPARLVVQTIEYRNRKRFEMLVGCTWIGRRSTPSEFFSELQRRHIPLRVLHQKMSFDPTPVLSALRLLRREKIDIIETHGYKACAIGFFLKLLSGKPWVAVMHGHTAENKKMSLYSALELNLSKSADRIITVSEEMRKRLVARGLSAEKTVTIHNAIDPEQFTCTDKAITRETFGVAATEHLIGVIGRFSPEKGQDVFIEAFKLLVAENSGVRAIFIGEGPTEELIRRRVAAYGLEEHIIFAGYQSGISTFYPLFDMVVMPSRSEGLPSVALEALFHRIPVVATSVGGTSEVIVDGLTGLLVPPENPSILAEAMSRILSDRPLARRLAASGEDLVLRRFLPVPRVRAFEAIYDLLAGGR